MQICKELYSRTTGSRNGCVDGLNTSFGTRQTCHRSCRAPARGVCISTSIPGHDSSAAFLHFASSLLSQRRFLAFWNELGLLHALCHARSLCSSTRAFEVRRRPLLDIPRNAFATLIATGPALEPKPWLLLLPLQYLPVFRFPVTASAAADATFPSAACLITGNPRVRPSASAGPTPAPRGSRCGASGAFCSQAFQVRGSTCSSKIAIGGVAEPFVLVPPDLPSPPSQLAAVRVGALVRPVPVPPPQPDPTAAFNPPLDCLLTVFLSIHVMQASALSHCCRRPSCSHRCPKHHHHPTCCLAPSAAPC